MDPDPFVNRPYETQQTYLGDGVYASFDGWHIWLRTQEGAEIGLEPATLRALHELQEKMKREMERPA